MSSYRGSGGGSRRPPDTDNMVSLKVDNLTYKTTTDTLRRVFDRYGEVGDVYIPRDPYTQESRGFAFVRFYDQRDADDAIDAMDGQVIDGRPVRVLLARHARPSGPGFGYRRGGGGRGGSRRRRSYSRSRSRSRSPRRRRHSKSRSDSRSRSRDRKNGDRHRDSGRRDDKKRSRSGSRNGRDNNRNSRSRSADD